jgi:tetratricopeptide (TPR) repeat protein
LVEIGNIYQYRQGALPQAIAAYEQVVERFVGNTAAPAAQLEIVHVYFKLKNYPQARAEAAKIIALWPTRPEAVRATFEVADAYYRERHYAQAVQTYDQLLAGQPPPTLATLVRFELGNCYQELGEPQRALDAYYSALPDHPNPTLVQRKIARVRSRIYNLAPSDSILNAQPPSRHLLALQYRRKAQQARHR